MRDGYKGSEYPGGWPSGRSPINELSLDELDLMTDWEDLPGDYGTILDAEYPYNNSPDQEPSLPVPNNIEPGEN
jgi:hypothetical protein